MQKKRYMLIHNNKDVYRFKTLTSAFLYAVSNCRGNNEFYIIVDTWRNNVVYNWSLNGQINP